MCRFPRSPEPSRRKEHRPFGCVFGERVTAEQQFARANQTLEGTLKKLTLVASAATALVCAASLIATPAASQQAYGPGHDYAYGPGPGYAYGPGPGPGYGYGPGYAYGPGPGYVAGPPHVPGGPVRSGDMCWSDRDSSANTGQGYWKACAKK
jgi:hypothetical protein